MQFNEKIDVLKGSNKTPEEEQTKQTTSSLYPYRMSIILEDSTGNKELLYEP